MNAVSTPVRQISPSDQYLCCARRIDLRDMETSPWRPSANPKRKHLPGVSGVTEHRSDPFSTPREAVWRYALICATVFINRESGIATEQPNKPKSAHPNFCEQIRAAHGREGT